VVVTVQSEVLESLACKSSIPTSGGFAVSQSTSVHCAH